MEICARNLRSVQQPLAALSSLESNERRRLSRAGGIFGDKNEDEVFCPKPRRPCSGPRRQRSSTPRSADVGFEILDIFLSKSSYGDASSFGCSPPYFSGSPPMRSGNPLVRDVQFGRQRPPPTPAAAAIAAITSSSSPPATPPPPPPGTGTGSGTESGSGTGSESKTGSTATAIGSTATGRLPPRETSRGSSPCIRVEGFASAGADIVPAIA